MKVQFIDAKDAPTAPRTKSAATIEAENIVNQLGKGKVARVEPEEGQTTRGLGVALGHAARVAGVKLRTWVVDGVLYVKLVS